MQNFKASSPSLRTTSGEVTLSDPEAQPKSTSALTGTNPLASTIPAISIQSIACSYFE